MYIAELNGRTKEFETRQQVLHWFWSRNDANAIVEQTISWLLHNSQTGINFEYKSNKFSFGVKNIT